MRRFGLPALLATVVLVGAATPASAGSPIKGARYAGKTSQGQAVSFRVSRSGRSISALRILSDDPCSDGMVNVGPNNFDPLSVPRSGRFSSTFDMSGGEVQSGQSRVWGGFRGRGRSVVGNFSSRYTFTDGVTCGVTLQFSARTRSR
jgi:hypothetical protein